MSNYKNSEGYYDPTAGAAISNCTKKERSDRRKATRKANARARKLAGQAAAEENTHRPLVYICSRYAGDTATNTRAARRYCRFAVTQNCIPFAAHLLYPQFLDDADKTERSLGLFFGNVLMDKCDEVWIFSDGGYSAGMQAEYDRAVRKGFTIRHFTTTCQEILQPRNGGANGRI